MAEPVGALYYEVTLDTGKMIAQQREVDRELGRTAKSLDDFGRKVDQITKAVSAYTAALYVIGQSDAYTKLNAQLKLATDSSSQFAKAQADVRRISQEAQTDISGVGALYARISTASKDLGVSQAAVADITRTVALALKVSGAGAQESASATLQLSQAFASGVLRGEEFNAVSEAAPRLMKALADGMGVPIGQLRSMAEQGQLTSDVLASALPKALGDLEKEAQSIQTIGGAFQTLRNEVLLFIGEQASASGAAKITSDVITGLAANLDTLAAAIYGFAAAKLTGTLIEAGQAAAATAKSILDHVAALQASRAAAIASAQAEVQKITAEMASLAAAREGIVVARQQYVAELELMNAFRARGLAMTQIGAVTTELATLGRQQAAVTAQQTAATAALSVAQSSLAKANAAAGATSGLVTSALGLLGGPIGAITTALGLGVTAWMLWGNASSDNEAKAQDSVERSTEEITADLDRQIAKLKERNALASGGLPGIAKQENEAAKRLATLQQQINDLQAGKGINGGAPLPEASRVALAQDLVRQYGELLGKIQAVNDEQDKLSVAGSSSKLTQWMTKYATDAERARIEIEKAKKELGSSFTPELELRIKEKFEPAKKTANKKPGQSDPLGSFITDQLNAQDGRDARAAEANTRVNEQSQADAMSTIVSGDPIAQLELQLQQKSEKLREAAERDKENAGLYAAAQVALERDTAKRMAQIREDEINKQNAEHAQRLQGYTQMFDSLAGIIGTFAGKQSGAYKAMFAVSKAFSIAQAVMSIATGTAKAWELGFPLGIPAAATVAAAGTSLISTISSTNYGGGRQYGGPVSSGSLYRVNETGKSEMFVAANGSQYLMPSANGKVVPANEVGGAGGGWKINIYNAPPGTTASVNEGARIIEIAVAQAEARVAGGIRDNTGPVWSALRGSTSVQSKL